VRFYDLAPFLKTNRILVRYECDAPHPQIKKPQQLSSPPGEATFVAFYQLDEIVTISKASCLFYNLYPLQFDLSRGTPRKNNTFTVPWMILTYADKSALHGHQLGPIQRP
jgi:hypothetical protein